MSAYALPGSFFPPIVPAMVPAAAAPAAAPQPMASPPTVKGPAFDPLQRPPEASDDNEKNACPSKAAGEGERRGDSGGSSSSWRAPGYGDLVVAVRSASVDPARLVRALARGGNAGGPGSGKGDGAHRRRRGRAPSGSDRDDGGSGASEGGGGGGGSRTDEAVQFLLSIRFNGRRYTATRTLPRFVQLRDELIAEMRERGGAVSRQARRVAAAKPWRRRAEVTTGSDADTVATREDNDFLDDDELEDLTVDLSLIPELPIGDRVEDPSGGGGGSLGIAGRGFAHLQATLRSYCPAMEGWLRHVADVVPPGSSPSLARFLWEPLRSGEGDADGSAKNAGNQAAPTLVPNVPAVARASSQSLARKGSGRGCRNLVTLDSINEFDVGYDDEGDAENDF